MTGLRQSLVQALASPVRTLPDDGRKEAAVAAIVTSDGRLWLVQRALHATDPWSGHLAFPGGKRAPQDMTLLETAIRETAEEVGLTLRASDCLGQLDDLEARPVRALRIRPFVFWRDDLPDWRLNPEIHCMVPVALDTLRAGVGRGVFRWPHAAAGVELPCVILEERRLWGLTLRMVDDLLRRWPADGLPSDPLHRR